MGSQDGKTHHMPMAYQWHANSSHHFNKTSQEQRFQNQKELFEKFN
jgi:hypothetical protein